MTYEEDKKVLDALIAAHVYLLHLPGLLFIPDEGDDCRDFRCFSCHALSGENHHDTCELLALAGKAGKARDIAQIAFNKQRAVQR